MFERPSFSIFISWILLLLACEDACGTDVPSAYVEIAREAGVPNKILYAVAVVESRRLFKGLRRPWPWTLNISGQAFYFETQAAAIEKLESEVSNGNMNIAIGIMQIYWRYHHHHFMSPSELLDARTNVRYGARYLRQMFENEGDWFLAVGQYHSGNKSPDGLKRAHAYAENVVKEWKKL